MNEYFFTIKYKLFQLCAEEKEIIVKIIWGCLTYFQVYSYPYHCYMTLQWHKSHSVYCTLTMCVNTYLLSIISSKGVTVLDKFQKLNESLPASVCNQCCFHCIFKQNTVDREKLQKIEAISCIHFSVFLQISVNCLMKPHQDFQRKCYDYDLCHNKKNPNLHSTHVIISGINTP